MQALRRSARSSALILKKPLSPSSRRFAHEEHGHGAADHGHGHGHAAGVDESIGIGFYLAVGVLPLSYAVYELSRADIGAKATAYLKTYDVWLEQYRERNELHTRLMEQAAADRSLFLYSKPVKTIEHRFPETFDCHSPYNVSAGQGPINLDKVIAKYNDEFFAEEVKKRALQVEGKLVEPEPRSVVEELKKAGTGWW